MDTVTPEQRSSNMQKIKSVNTKPEIYFRKLLFSRGIRYRIYSRKILGKPDLYLKKYNTAIFVHGCFWHQHEDCKYARIPKTRPEYWIPKLERNKKHDQEVKEKLLNANVRVIIIWECLLKKMAKDPILESSILEKVIHFLSSPSEKFLELP